MTKKSYFNGELGQRFGFRKYLGVGLCSVALSAFFVTSSHTEQVKADTLDDASSSSEALNMTPPELLTKLENTKLK